MDRHGPCFCRGLQWKPSVKHSAPQIRNTKGIRDLMDASLADIVKRSSRYGIVQCSGFLLARASLFGNGGA